MTERKPLRINHGDGTLTIYGARSQSFDALQSSADVVPESHLEESIKQARIPFDSNIERIVGWGGFSVAVRLNGTSQTSENNPSQQVLVFRPLKEEDGAEGLSSVATSWEDELVVNQQFAPFTVPQRLVITNGVDQEPTAIKVAREVEGATFNEASTLAVLGNPYLLEQYIQFCQRAIDIFVTEGKLIDTSGHLAQNMLRQMWIGMIPFYSDNLIVEYGSNELKFVDCDVKANIHFFEKADLQQKLGLLARSGFLVGTVLTARVFTLAHRARNRLFEEKYTSKGVEKVQSGKEYQNFNLGLQEVIQALNSAGINFRVVGSVALAGTIQSAGNEFYLTPRRINRTRRDIDIIVLNGEQEKIQAVRQLVGRIKKRTKTIKGYPDVSLTTPIGINQSGLHGTIHPHDRILPTEFTRIGMDSEGNAYLVYKDIAIRIPEAQLEPVTVTYERIEFPTVSPGVLAGLALTRGGNFRPRDLKKIKILFDHTRFRIPSEFRDFVQSVRRRHPSSYRNFLIREWLHYWSGGFISGGQITKFIERVREH